MRKPNSQEIICVNCNSSAGGSEPAPPQALPNGNLANGNLVQNEEEEIEAAPRPLRDRITPSTNLPHDTNNPGFQPTPAAVRQVDPSQAIADKMLEGWALLAEHCPLCSTPFVRSRNGRIYCVTCDLYAVKEEDATSSGGAGQPPQQEQRPAGATNIATTTATGGILNASTRPLPSPNNLETDDTVSECVVTAQKFVAARLANISAALEKASSSSEAMPLLEEIKACVEALHGIKALLN
jgi:uncharacterized Zn finger protein (UPF0148 family)